MKSKKMLFWTAVIFLLAASSAWSAPGVSLPSIDPPSITVGHSTPVIIGVKIDDPGFIRGSANLLLLDDSGKAASILGAFHDDGLAGDGIAGDNIYTIRREFRADKAGKIRLQISAAFKGLLKRVLSPPFEIAVEVANQPPLAWDQSVTTKEDTPIVITLEATDAENDPLVYAIVTSPAHGTLTGMAPSLTYTPAANYFGSDGFTFKANDGKANSNIAMISLLVLQVNHPPQALNQSVFAEIDTPRAITLSGLDVDGDFLRYTIITPPFHGVLSGIPPALTYRPSDKYTGPDNFSFRVNDGRVDSNVATISITVNTLHEGPIITTVAGNGTRGHEGDGGPAVEANLGTPVGVAADNLGNLYLADQENSVIRKVDREGVITRFAGNGWGGCWEEGDAKSVSLGDPHGIVLDAAGNMYIADPICHRIRKVDANGKLTTVAGSIPPCCHSDYFSGTFGGDGQSATGPDAALNRPEDVAVDAWGNLYLADAQNHRVRKVDTNGILTTVAGTGARGYSGDGGPAVQAQLGYPSGVAVDPSGNLYIADQWNDRIRMVDTRGIISTIAGNGDEGFGGDGGPAVLARLRHPQGVALDGWGNIYIADASNYRIRRVERNGIVTTIAGTGARGYSGDGGPAAEAQLTYPRKVAADLFGNVFIGDTYNWRVRKVSHVTEAMKGTFGGKVTDLVTGLPLPGVAVTVIASLQDYATTTDSEGGYVVAGLRPGEIRVFFANPGYVRQIVQFTLPPDEDRTIDLSLARTSEEILITTIAGNGTEGFSGDGGPALEASLAYPRGVAVDLAGNVYIADSRNNRVRKIDPAGKISVFAGNGVSGYGGDGGPASMARLNSPGRLAADSQGNLFIAEYVNNRVRRVDSNGIITTVAGVGGWGGYGGDGGLAIQALLNGPSGIAADSMGNLYIADYENERVRKVDAAGIITTVAGNGSWGHTDDGGPATLASLAGPSEVTLDRSGNLYISCHNHTIRRVDARGIITTVAGNQMLGFSGDGGLARKARFNGPEGIAVGVDGNLYIADSSNSRIRMVDEHGMISSIAGIGEGGYGGDGGPAIQAMLNHPSGIAFDRLGNLYIADRENDRIRVIKGKNAGGIVAGMITDSSTGLPLGNVKVTFTDSGHGTYVIYSSWDGSYAFGGVLSGAFTVVFEKTGYRAETVNGVLSADETRTLDIELTLIPLLSLKVTSPQDGVTVNSSPITVSGEVNNNAEVTVNGIEASVRDNLFSATIPLVEGPNVITVTATDSYGHILSRTVQAILLTGGAVTGAVTDALTGLPLPGAAVSITDFSNIVRTSATDSTGSYSIGDLSPGRYVGTIRKEGYVPFSFSGVLPPGQTATANGALNPILPVITNVVVSLSTMNSATITWTTDQPADSFVEYGTTSSYGNWVRDGSLTNSHSVILNSLALGTIYHFKVTSINAYGFPASSGDHTFTTRQSFITLAITSPSPGALINRSDVLVKGIIASALGHETGVTVNGKVATVSGNEFEVNHLPLGEGSNTIHAVAVDAEGNTAAADIEINSAEPAGYLNLRANAEAGISPLEVILTVESSQDLAAALLTYTGPGEVEFISRSPNEYRVKMITGGMYYFTASLEGTPYQDSIGIAVLDKSAMDALLKTKWEGVRRKLLDRDVEGALVFFDESKKEGYRELFNAVSTALPTLVLEWSDIQLIELADNTAVCDIQMVRDGAKYSFQLLFTKDSTGIWKINYF